MHNKSKINILVLGLVLVLAVLGCGSSGGGGGDDDDDVNTPNAPTYTLTGDQEKLINDEGIPEYLTIIVDADSGRREETWTYVTLQKTVIYWDGDRVQELPLVVDPAVYSNPPYIDPRKFTSATTKQDILDLFGNNYVEDDQSEGSLSFETFYYENLGLVASFTNDKLVTVQTVDLP